jgi:hypothetical protein
MMQIDLSPTDSMAQGNEQLETEMRLLWQM